MFSTLLLLPLTSNLTSKISFKVGKPSLEIAFCLYIINYNNMAQIQEKYVFERYFAYLKLINQGKFFWTSAAKYEATLWYLGIEFWSRIE